jgi:hypothetical protein
MGVEFDLALAIQGEGSAGQAQTMGDPGFKTSSREHTAALQQARRQRHQQRFGRSRIKSHPGSARRLT